MYEQNNDGLEESIKSTCATIECRPEEWENTQKPLEPISTCNGQRMANPSEPTSCEGKRKGCNKKNMERIRNPRSRNPVHKKIPHKEQRVASLGKTPNDSGKSLHPEEKTQLVNCPRPDGAVSVENVLKLLDYQQHRCALTGRKLTPQTAALDHIIPIRFDGEHVIDNAQVLHKDVNRAKGSLTNDEFIDMCLEVALWTK